MNAEGAGIRVVSGVSTLGAPVPVRNAPSGHDANFVRFALAGCLFALLLAPEAGHCATKPTVHKSTKTVNIPKKQFITVAKHTAAFSTTQEVDVKIAQATQILQEKGGSGDVVCPIKFQRQGAISSFTNDPGLGFDFNIIDSDLEMDLLLDLVAATSRARIVSLILNCNGPISAMEGALGCGNFSANELTFGFALGDFAFWDGHTLAHEFGHNQGLADLVGVPFQDRIMWEFQDVDQKTGEEVTAQECSRFKL